MSGLYWHVPFCKKACHYCDFHFETTTRSRQKMVVAMIKECGLRAQETISPINSLYFGGGTPSILSLNDIESMVKKSKELVFSPHAEITIEANPDDLNLEFLLALKEMGFNRLSIGVQSFNPKNLVLLNRAHDDRQAFACIESAHKAGFDNISIDLMYGLPGQSLSDWEQELDTAFSIGIQHLSAYCLTIERGTAFENWYKNGKLPPVCEDTVVEQFLFLNQYSKEKNFDHYEISNLSIPGFYSKHNTNYWKKGTYIGIGPSAHSYNGLKRSFNIPNNKKYIDSLEVGNLPSEKEILSPQNHYNETIMTGLRTKWGISISQLSKIGHQPNHNIMNQWVESEFAYFENDDHFKLTPKGWLLADKIAGELFWVE